MCVWGLFANTLANLFYVQLVFQLVVKINGYNFHVRNYRSHYSSRVLARLLCDCYGIQEPCHLK